MGSAPVGVQCPLTSSLGEFPGYWDWLWYPGLSPVLVSNAFPFAFHIWVFSIHSSSPAIGFHYSLFFTVAVSAPRHQPSFCTRAWDGHRATVHPEEEFYVHTYAHDAYINTFMRACIRTYIHTHRHTYLYIHTYVHTYVHMHIGLQGPFIKYVTLFLAKFDPPLPVTLCHTSRDPRKYVTHPGPPPRFLVGLVQKSRTKVPCTNYISIVRGGFCPGVFVWVGFCPFPLLSQYICYNRKLNITLNFMFHMYDKNLYKDRKSTRLNS